MSLSELTRNAIVAGIPSDKWETLVRRWAERQHPVSFPQRVSPAFGNEIWKGIRPLLRVFPRDKTLQLYLQKAIDSNLLPLRLYVVGLLAWIAEDIIHNQDVPAKEEELSLVDMLCQMVISMHYARNGGLDGILQPHTTVLSVTGVTAGPAGYHHHHPRARRIPEATLDVSTLMETAIHAADFCKYSLTTEVGEQAAAASNNGTHPTPHTPSHPSPSSSGPFYHTLDTTSSEILSLVLDSIDQNSASVAPHHLIARLSPLMKDLNDVSTFLSPSCATHVMQWTHHLAFVALSSPGDIYMDFLSGTGLGGSSSAENENVEAKSLTAASQAKATSTPQPYVSDGLDVRSVMLLRMLVDSADTIGAGNQPSAIARLLATYRSMESDVQVFLDNIILASIRILAQVTQLARSRLDPSSLPEDLVRWRVFTLSRLPVLLARLGEVIEVALSDERPQLAPDSSSFRSSLKLSLTTLFTEHSDLLNTCAYDDHPFKTRSPDLFGEDEEMNESDGQDAEKRTLAFKADLLVGYQAVSLMDPETVLQLAGRDISSVTGNGKILADAEESGVPVEAYIAMKLDADMLLEETLSLIDTAVWDYSSHLILVLLVQQKYATAVAPESANLESLAFISRLLHTHRHLLDIITLHQSSIMVNLVGSALAFASSFSFANVGDVQSALGHFGDIVLFIQTAFRRFRYRLNHEAFVGKNGQPIDPRVFVSVHTSLPISCLPQGDQQIAQNWLKAIFDLNSHGIDDQLLLSTAPQSLLRLTPSLFVQALSDYVATGSSDRETLKNGASYFHNTLLNWTLPGVLVALAEDTQRQGAAASIHVELLSIIIASSGCPRPALLLAGFALLRLFGSEPFQSLAQAVNVDIVPLKNRIRNALGLGSVDPSQPIIRNQSVPYIDAPRLIIRDALTHASVDPVPLNLPILFQYPPNHVVMGLFHELRSTTSSTEGTEVLSPQATAVSVSILTTPRGGSASPRPISISSVHETLLPYTLKVFLPKLISGITDADTVALEMDILCAMIGTSVVAQRQYERATRVLAAHNSRVGEDIDMDPMPQDGVSSSVSLFVQWLKEPNASAVRASLLKRLHAVPEYTGHFVVG